MNKDQNTSFKKLLMNPFINSRQLWSKFELDQALQESQSMQKIIEREKARAIRDRQKLSLIVFHLEHQKPEGSAVACLTETIKHRTRLTDEWGWLDAKRICVILPNTDSDGARRLAEDISQSISSDLLREPCTLYTFPSECSIDLNTPDPMSTVRIEMITSSNKFEHQVASPTSSFGLSRTFFWKQTSSHHLVPRQPITLKSIEQLPGLKEHPLPRWKRSLDITLAIFMLLVCSPIILFAALCIKCISPGPVFIKQVRVGYKKQLFKCWKLRTMKWEGDTSVHQAHMFDLVHHDKPMKKLQPDPRMIPFLGKLIRLSGFDEIPQLVNVLKGEMSIVGPRPCLEYEIPLYQQWQQKRFDILPGLTGLWQVEGKNNKTFNEMIRFDITYIHNLSFKNDLTILFKTIPVVIQEVYHGFTKPDHS